MPMAQLQKKKSQDSHTYTQKDKHISNIKDQWEVKQAKVNTLNTIQTANSEFKSHWVPH